MIALKQLDKIIRQDIDLTELDPEKAKAAVQGKKEAFEYSLAITDRIAEELAEKDQTKKNDFGGFAEERAKGK